MKRAILVGVVAVTMSLTAAHAQATPLTVNVNNSADLAAQAIFDIVGSNLQVTLTNTSLVDVLNPSQILTAVFFDLVGAGTLTPVSATLNSGSTVFFGSNGGGNVGGEWGYSGSLSGAPLGASSGISSSGFGLFGGGTFNGPDLSPPTALNGLNYGITSAGDDLTTGNQAVTGKEPLIKNSVLFTFSGLNSGFVLSDDTVTHVSFQYGTALSEPNVTPEPASFSLLLASFGVLATFALFRKRATPQLELARS